MVKFHQNEKNQIKVGLVVLLIISALIAAGLIQKIRKEKGGYFSDVQWSNPVPLEIPDAFGGLKLNPFEK